MSKRAAYSRFFLSRQLVFRLIAIFLGLTVIAAAEGLLRLTDWGKPANFDDPYVAFREVKPLFELNQQGDRYQIPVSRRAFFQPESFPATKGESEFRIFCLGGSTVQGRPYSIETSFTSWLELSLTAADPSQDWQVINCGGVSYASYRLLPIMQEVLAYHPDLFILYTGHNEFLEDRTYPHLKRTPAWLKNWHHRLTSSRIYGLLWHLRSSFEQPSRNNGDSARTTLGAEVDALLDYRGGLEQYHRDDTWRHGVIEHFELNLRRMVRLADDANVPLVIVNPVSNLRDSPPFKTERQQSLSQEQQDAFTEIWEEARSTDWEHLDKKAELVTRALAIDNRHADAHFLLAKVYDAMGQSDKAKSAYVRAKDEDICPLRILERMHDILFLVARQTDTPLLDIRSVFEAHSKDGIPGDDMLIDHVHPKIEGHQLIAQELFEAMVRQRFVTPRSGWHEEQQALYTKQWKSLAPNYFPESVQRLRGLRRWSEGRSSRLRPNSQKE